MYSKLTRCTSLQNILRFSKRNLTQLRSKPPQLRNFIQKSPTFLMYGFSLNFFKSEKVEDPALLTDINLTDEMRTACHRNVNALIELMHTINYCVQEINRQYQCCMDKQMEITSKCLNIGPVGEHWDELTKYRIQADELKMEFNKYEMLVHRVGQMVFYQAVTSLMSGNEKEMDLLNAEYNKLEKCVSKINNLNKEIETKLLTVNRDSILYGK